MKKTNRYKIREEKIKIKFDRSYGYIRDLGTTTYISIEKKRRDFGAHLTSIDIFKKFIFPEIKEKIILFYH